MCVYLCSVYLYVFINNAVSLSSRTFLLDPEKILASTTPYGKEFLKAGSPWCEDPYALVLNCAPEGSHNALCFLC